MIRGVSGAVAVAALLVCCSADTHQEQDVASAGEHGSANRYDANGHKTRNLDPLGGGHLLRDVREARSGLMYLVPRGLYNDAPRSYDLRKREFDEIDRSGLDTFFDNSEKREDRSDLNAFITKRNFDEIDRSDLNPFIIGKRKYDGKRVFHGYRGHNNFLDTPIEGWRQMNGQKRLIPDYPMDEIDVSFFPIGGSS